MKSNLFFIYFFFICVQLSAQNRIVIGSLETNIVWDKQETKYPFFVMSNFEKVNNIWKIIVNEKYESKYDQYYLPKINFNVFYNGKTIGRLNTVYDTTMPRIAFVQNSYRITNKNVPHIGNKQLKFSGEIFRKIYRPLVTSNVKFCIKREQIRSRKYKTSDSVFILKYLKAKALVENLGELPNYGKNVIEKINRVLIINDSTFFINANLNLNINCILDSIPFDRDSAYAGYSFGANKDNLAKYHYTPKAEFLIKGEKIMYVDYNTSLLDYGDYDNDGFDDFVFKFEKLWYDGYILVTNKLSQVLVNGWGYN